MYNIFDFLLIPARNKTCKGKAREHFIFVGTSKISLMLYIIRLNVVCAIHFITVAKHKMYCMGVKSIAE